MLFCSQVTGFLYKAILKPILFHIDAERVHEGALKLGLTFGKSHFLSSFTDSLFKFKNRQLEQEINGVRFENPVGLAAGFDYNAELTEIIGHLGFGFSTIGTITNKPYGGNPKPRLGRLPKSRSLLVNKGYKNKGVIETLASLKGAQFSAPIGISIGATNAPFNENEEKATKDIASAFRKVEESDIGFSYYELNISCPNLSVCLDFYSPDKLKALLEAVFGLHPSKPVFVKMPIVKTDDEVRTMLDVISKYPVSGVIFGNLQKDRGHPSLDREEVASIGKGNFSGKPTEKRSNELIELAYKEYGERLKVIGCGGVFSAEDAYKKIKLGASMIQLITGMVYEGPQLIGEINRGLNRALEKDGFHSISEAVGAGVK